MRSRRAIGGIAVVAVLLTACPEDVPERGAPEPGRRMVVALVATLSGNGRWRGPDARRGVRAAIANLKAGDDDGSETIELVVRDDRGDPARATRLVERLAGLEDVAGVVYAGSPRGLPPAEDALASSGIPAIACYGDLHGAGLLGPHQFQMAPPFRWSAEVMADYVLGDRGYTRIGMLSEASVMGDAARRAVEAELARRGRELVASAVFTPTRLGRVEDLLGGLRDAEVQALLVEAAPGEFSTVLRALRDMGASYRSTAEASSGRSWRPQVLAFDLAISPTIEPTPVPGTAAVETLARGLHYLPAFRSLKRRMEVRLGGRLLGWERRAYEATLLVDWAARRTGPGQDGAEVLEGLGRGELGGWGMGLGPHDHVVPERRATGLWVVPHPAARLAGRTAIPRSLPWVPLARTFGRSQAATELLGHYGVRTASSDPVH